jgi:uncharacterized damage-inducible protein DinB
MYTNEALLDLHTRVHHCFDKLLVHCEQLEAEDLHKEIPGFGYLTIQLQIHHMVGAEEYWLGVLAGCVDVEDTSAKYPTLDLLKTYRLEIATATQMYLQATQVDILNTPKERMTWGDRKLNLVPAHVILRTQTHIHHHIGQILAMCRLLNKPATGMDFPIQ